MTDGSIPGAHSAGASAAGAAPSGAPPAFTPAADSPAAPNESPAAARREDTVGDFSTVHGTGEELALSWSEGLLVADRFRVIRCIGQGGMGMVYLAHDQSLDRPIALKRVPQEILFDGDARDDLRQEANRLLDLAHENIIRVHTYYDEPTWPFFAMEFLQGPTLKELLRLRKQEGRSFLPQEVQAVARQVERGLSYAHGKGIIHRDLKPGNLMFAAAPGAEISDRDVIKITDFGISRVVADSTMRQTGKRSGTLPYMSPEQFRGDPASASSDVYSLAATYYELLTGKPPFYTGDIGYQIMNIGPRPLSGVPKPMADALHKGLSKNPRHRPGSVKELTDAMDGKTPSPIRLALRKSPRLVRAGALVLGAVLTVAILVFWIKAIGYDSRLGSESLAGPANSQARPAAAGPLPADALDPDLLDRAERAIDLQLDEANVKGAIRQNSFRFVIGRRPDLPPEVLGRLQFLLIPPNSSGREPIEIRGRAPVKEEERDGLEFSLENLADGEYLLSAVLDQAKFPRPHGRRFWIDRSGPAIEIAAVSREELIEEAPLRFFTYNDRVDIKLSTPTKPGDLEKAYYQVYADSMFRDRQRIADFTNWRVSLDLGENQFRVIAFDPLGNDSTKMIRIFRLGIKVVSFEIDKMAGGISGISGNTVAVRGRVNIEKLAMDGSVGLPAGNPRGLGPPILRYYMNEALVTPIDSTDATPDNQVFKARLLLPRARNSIEVRYQWGDGMPRPFEDVSAGKLQVDVPAPRIEINPLPKFTNKFSLELVGRVVPYFDGLKVQLLHEQVGSYPLQLKPGRDSAEFSELTYLVENKMNRFSFTVTYRDIPLSPSGTPAAVEVYCDITPPKLLDDVEFSGQGEFVEVVINPTEPLSSLQMSEASGEWRQISPRNDGRYIARVPLPREKEEFQFEMVDLAGNKNVVKQVCPIYDPDAPAPERVVRAPAAREDQAKTVPATARMVPRSDLLKELNLEFIPYGAFKEEMGTTEVNQRAWSAFLKEDVRRDVPDGDAAMPMTIDERFDPNLLNHFASWLTQRSADGYRYYVPTAKQWMTAFTGSRDPRDAIDDIKHWFNGQAGGFNTSPRRRYSSTTVLPCGERPENRTPTGLLDMEANLQEVVHDESGSWWVIGGWNANREKELVQKCTVARPYAIGATDWMLGFTGFRLGRKPE